jgi:hypothetical protein
VRLIELQCDTMNEQASGDEGTLGDVYRIMDARSVSGRRAVVCKRRPLFDATSVQARV